MRGTNQSAPPSARPLTFVDKRGASAIRSARTSEPSTRAYVAGNLHTARTGLAALFLNQPESRISEHTAQTIGTFLHVLLSGLIVQWLIDPASALSAKALTEALRTTAQGLQKNHKVSRPKRKPAKPKR